MFVGLEGWKPPGIIREVYMRRVPGLALHCNTSLRHGGPRGTPLPSTSAAEACLTSPLRRTCSMAPVAGSGFVGMSGQAVGGLRFLLEAAIAVDESPRPGNQVTRTCSTAIAHSAPTHTC